MVVPTFDPPPGSQMFLAAGTTPLPLAARPAQLSNSQPDTDAASLPDAPDATLMQQTNAGSSSSTAAAPPTNPATSQATGKSPTGKQPAGKAQSGKPVPPPCPAAGSVSYSDPEAASAAAARTPCIERENPYRLFLNSTAPSPLTPRQKGILAFRNVTDPFNLLTVVGNSAVTIAADSHTAYGPGWKGFGRNAGYSLVEDATGEVVGTFLICSAFHEDPHYHRMPEARPMRRAVHAIVRTVVAQSDEGRLMPNFENLLGYPASAEISNLYVPGIHGNAPSTVARVLTGLATDPIGNLITEFLPDVAKRVHVRIVFVQQVINDVATGKEL